MDPAALPAGPPEPPPVAPTRPRLAPTEAGAIRRWVRQQDIRQVVGRYVRLSKRGVGRCPWGERHKHGDAHPSFAVFDDTQKWWCFSERIGGDAFDFLCRYHALDATAMLRRLRLR